MNQPKIFLGGTCNGTTWRNELIPLLEEKGFLYFNPIVKDWTPECKKIEDNEKLYECGIDIFVITSQMTGVYSIVEIMEQVYNACLDQFPIKVIVGVIREGFDRGQLKSFQAMFDDIRKISNKYVLEGTIECAFIDNVEQLISYLYT